MTLQELEPQLSTLTSIIVGVLPLCKGYNHFSFSQQCLSQFTVMPHEYSHRHYQNRRFSGHQKS